MKYLPSVRQAARFCAWDLKGVAAVDRWECISLMVIGPELAGDQVQQLGSQGWEMGSFTPYEWNATKAKYTAMGPYAETYSPVGYRVVMKRRKN
jgi:hypothetical protein